MKTTKQTAFFDGPGYSRVRMSWDWVEKYPIFVYTRFIDHNHFKVKLVLGTKGDQNAGYTGPGADAWREYEERGISSKKEVVRRALNMAAFFLKKEGKIPQDWTDPLEYLL